MSCKRTIPGLGMFLLLGGYLSVDAISSSSEFRRISVVPTDTSRNEYYVAQGKTVVIQFHNEDAPNPAKVFPDPLVVITNISSHAKCEITGESGIWAGNDVYLNEAENIVVLNEYGGANSFLKLFDTSTCHKITQLDVSGRLWEITGTSVRMGRQCAGGTVQTCKKVTTYSLPSNNRNENRTTH